MVRNRGHGPELFLFAPPRRANRYFCSDPVVFLPFLVIIMTGSDEQCILPFLAFVVCSCPPPCVLDFIVESMGMVHDVCGSGRRILNVATGPCLYS